MEEWFPHVCRSSTPGTTSPLASLAAAHARMEPKGKHPSNETKQDVGRSKKRRRIDADADVGSLPHAKQPGRAYVWGDGTMGQLGLGDDEIEKFRPVPIDIGREKVSTHAGVDRSDIAP